MLIDFVGPQIQNLRFNGFWSIVTQVVLILVNSYSKFWSIRTHLVHSYSCHGQFVLLLVNSYSFWSIRSHFETRPTSKGAECHIYLYYFTFVYIDLNRAIVIIVLFSKNIAVRKCVQMVKESEMN